MNADDFLVFERYRDATDHAFSNNVVTEADKDSYARIFSRLKDAVAGAIVSTGNPQDYGTWICNFGRDGGAQGHRPKSLWASVINADSDAFSRFPQVYAIASAIGVEVGFSVTIHEDDYYDVAAKQKNRAIIPIVNAKLPDPEGPLIGSIQQVLEAEEGWIIAEKTRNGFQPAYPDLPDLIADLRSGHGSDKGGGAIYRILDFAEAASSPARIEEELGHALSLFAPLMAALRPSGGDVLLVTNMSRLADEAAGIPAFDPYDDVDGRNKVLREVAIRQGQQKFRQKVLDAYDRRCAISGCTLEWILQAAHISPYNGAKSNHVSNGIPLRADIHTLFDLGLLRIDPESRKIHVAPALHGTEYEQYTGQTLASPVSTSHRPRAQR